MSGESFLSRWSRRKVGVDDESAESTEAAVAKVDPAAAPPAVASDDSPQSGPIQPPLESTFVEPPPLDSVANDGDFAPFMQREISPELRNQAMKKLFTDPHYNVMDRLDTYIDDYSKPDPMPAGMLEQLYQSKALFLFADKENETEPDEDNALPASAVPAVEEPAALSPIEKQPQPKLEE